MWDLEKEVRRLNEIIQKKKQIISDLEATVRSLEAAKEAIENQMIGFGSALQVLTNHCVQCGGVTGTPDGDNLYRIELTNVATEEWDLLSPFLKGE